MAKLLRGDASSQNQSGLKMDVEDPDLYIPLMAYITYVLVFGLQRIRLEAFSPEVLPKTLSFGMVMLILEVGAAKFGFYIAGSTQMTVLEIAGNCGCKFVYLSLLVLVRIATANQIVYYVAFAYLSGSCAFAVRHFMKQMKASAMQEQYGCQPSALHMTIITALAVAQFPLCWVLTPWSTK